MISLSARLEADVNARVPRRCYRVVVLDRYREPLGGVGVELVLAEGGGTFEFGDSAGVRTEVTTDDGGEAYFDWYWPRAAELPFSAEVRMACGDERAVDIVIEAQIEMPWI